MERGERLRVWFVPYNDSWIRAKDHPDAEKEEAFSDRRDQRCPPGTIWKREIEVKLPPGTHLLSRVTTPLVEEMDAMDYLLKERRGMRRHVEEFWFQVVGNYRTMKSHEPASFSEARMEHQARGDAAKRPKHQPD